MQTKQITGMNVEMFHVQTSTAFALPANTAFTRIGKLNQDIPIDIDVSGLPNAEIVSRTHAEIIVKENVYYLIDTGSSNGTFINGMQLVPNTNYPLNLGDQIDFGRDSKVTFIFQPQSYSNLAISNPTTLQAEVINHTQTSVDQTSKFFGLALIVAGVVIVAGNARIGLFVQLPSVLLLIGGVVLLVQQRVNRNWGWVAIALGVGMILFTGRVFASVNLLNIILASALLFAGYQLYTTGKVFNHSLSSVKRLLKGKRD